MVSALQAAKGLVGAAPLSFGLGIREGAVLKTFRGYSAGEKPSFQRLRLRETGVAKPPLFQPRIQTKDGCMVPTGKMA